MINNFRRTVVVFCSLERENFEKYCLKKIILLNRKRRFSLSFSMFRIDEGEQKDEQTLQFRRVAKTNSLTALAISNKQNQNFVLVQTLIRNNPHKYLKKYKCDMYDLDLRTKIKKKRTVKKKQEGKKTLESGINNCTMVKKS